MEPWLIVLLAAVLVAGAAAGAYWYYRRQRAMPPIAPRYVSGGANYMITLGIGTPAEIGAFLLLGLAAGVTILANRKKGHKSGYPFRGFY